MVIKNTTELSTNKLRSDALEIIEAAFASIDTKTVIERNLRIENNFLFVGGKYYDLSHYRSIYLLAFGKDSFAAAGAIKHILGDRLSSGAVLSQESGTIEGLNVYQCTHPKPSDQNVKATKQAVELLKQASEDDLVLIATSGGGSAMLSAPYKISVDQKAKIAEMLMDSGADINELNIVRKHLSEIKGGHLAALLYPATVAVMVFSDVVGDDLSTIASGPTVPDHTTTADAKKVLLKYQVLEKLGLDDLELNESPKEQNIFHKVDHFLLLTNEVACRAMAKKAEELGYSSRIFSHTIQGLASEVGKKLLAEAKSGEALIAAGETTVKVKGNGEGGRSQEMVLANLDNIKDNQLLSAFDSDGWDNSPLAGALGDKTTLEKAKSLKINPKDFLEKSDSFTFFTKVGSGVYTGKLDTNVADLMFVLTEG